jgi:hypothetical protein
MLLRRLREQRSTPQLLFISRVGWWRAENVLFGFTFIVYIEDFIRCQWRGLIMLVYISLNDWLVLHPSIILLLLQDTQWGLGPIKLLFFQLLKLPIKLHFRLIQTILNPTRSSSARTSYVGQIISHTLILLLMKLVIIHWFRSWCWELLSSIECSRGCHPTILM